MSRWWRRRNDPRSIPEAASVAPLLQIQSIPTVVLFCPDGSEILRIAGFDGRHPRAWLFTIMRDTHINGQRRRRPELLHDPDTTLAHLEAPEPAGGNVEDHVVDQTFEAVVEASLRDLSPKYRQVVELVDIDGLTYEEAADTLGVPVGTVMSRLHRARRRMRDELARAGIAPRRPR